MFFPPVAILRSLRPINNASDETLLTERSADWASGAVAEPVAWGLGASQSFGQWFPSVGRKSGAVAGKLGASGEHISEAENKTARSGVGEVWSRNGLSPN